WTTKQAVARALELDRTAGALTRIEIRNRPSGAPYVQIDGEKAAVDISMTDRSGWAVCLVGQPGTMASGTVGVDLEVVEARTARFVADYFTSAERDYVRREPAHRHDELANLIWSAKEAALKVQQVGLRVDTRTVEVDLHSDRQIDGWSAMTITGSDGPMPGWWRRCGVFVLTIAFAHDTGPPQLLPSSSDLHTAIPQHSWVHSPVC
ncbi:MAG: 4'-phosphopantetheinyl transferase family protein, partial [Acidimicrobiales bacterium]